ncbi:Probable cinnamyl alcohol dehydrogenase 9 [Linum perenne]
MAKKSPETEHPHKAFGWAARDSSGVLSPFNFSRRENGDEDVTIKIHYCGICHSDLHFLKNEWGFTRYPLVPGHEIVGIVTKSGPNVTKFKPNDRVGVGVMVGSCKSCDYCNQDLENYCPQMVFTYNATDADGSWTYGGYSDTIVVNQRFVVRFPDALPFDAGAPLLCAGVTVYSPMKYGLGHVAVKIGKAFGLKVTVISSSPGKESEAVERLGADAFLVSTDPVKIKAGFGTMDFIIDTVSAVHSLAPLLALLKPNGKLITLGLPDKPLELPIFPLVLAKHGITADVEVIPIDQVNVAMDRLAKSDVRYRFVIDVVNSLSK